MEGKVHFLVIYALLFLMGAGFSYRIFRSKEPNLPYIIAFSPIIGYALYSSASVYSLAFNLGKHWIFAQFAIISSVSLLMVLFSPGSRTSTRFPMKWGAYIISVLIVMFSFNNVTDNTYYHFLGPDLTIYSTSAEYLSRGGRLYPFSGSGLVHELMIDALRWGLPSFIALPEKLAGIDPTSALFPTVIILFSSSIWVVSQIFAEVFGIKDHAWEVLVSIALLLNATLLFFISNEFYPYAIGVAFTSLTAAMTVQWTRLQGRDKFVHFLLLCLILTSLIATCSELFVVNTFLIGGFCMFRMLGRDRNVSETILVLAIPITFLAVFPLAVKIIAFTIANIKNSNAVGYIQPSWFWPSDITGLTNVYSAPKRYLDEALSVHMMQRKPVEWMLTIATSCWVAYELLKARRNALLLTMVFGSFCFLAVNLLAFGSGTYESNYLYSKLVMVFSPALTAFFFAGIEESSMTVKKAKRVIALFLIIAGTVFFSVRRQDYLGYVDMESIRGIHSAFEGQNIVFLPNERGYVHGKVHGKMRYIDRTSELFIGPLLGWKAIDQWMPDTWASFPPDARIILIAQKDRLISEPESIRKYADRLVLSTRSYLVIDTKTTMSELFSEKNIADLYIR